MMTQTTPAQHYADINGLHMYYEIHGAGEPLVLIHGGGSTIESTFSKMIPLFAATYQVIAVEMQAHGHTKDIDRPLSFEQDADDINALLEQLHIDKAFILGFSNGATTAMQVGIRHPQRAAKLVLVSTLAKRSGVDAAFWEGFPHATLDHMPKPLQEAQLRANPDPKALQAMFDRDVQRMLHFKDIPDEAIRSIAAPTLVIGSEKDVMHPEHSVEIYRLLPQGQLVILPGYHGELLGAAEADQQENPLPGITATLVTRFLDSK